MCGIVGFMSNETYKDFKARKSWFETALQIDVIRGWDSTGVFSVNANNHVENRKGAMLPWEFLDMRQVQGMLTKHSWKCIVGHNRAATIGAKSGQNAHPFEQGKITGVHNGTLDFSWRQYLPDANDFDVDSQAIFNAFDKKPFQEIIEQLDGAFTLVWHDKEDKVMRIIRNKQRPLFLIKAKDEETIFFSSEDWIGLGPAKRIGYKIEEIIQPVPGTLYEFPLNNITNFKEEKLKLYQSKKVKVVPFNSDKEKVQEKVRSYKELGINSKTKYSFDIEQWVPYEKDDKRGYLTGVSPMLTDKEGKALNCVLHNIILKDFLKECETDSVRNVMVRGKPTGLTYPKGHTGTPYILINYKNVDFFVQDNHINNNDSWNFNDLMGPDGEPISHAKWLDMTEDGCCMCGDMLIPGSHKKIKWYAGNNPVCTKKSCQTEAEYAFQEIK